MECEGTLVYAAKFFCGGFAPDVDIRVVDEPVEPGHYSTAINVHNPHPRRCAHFRKKAVLLFQATLNRPPARAPFEPPMPPGPLIQVELKPDWALEITGREIREELLNLSPVPGPLPFITGWVVIEVGASTPLDVVAAYTARPFDGQSIAMTVDRVRPTSICD